VFNFSPQLLAEALITDNLQAISSTDPKVKQTEISHAIIWAQDANFSLWSLRFNPGNLHAKFTMDEVTQEQVLL
jgi:hypothetical protein